jgi:RES domain-containing protein
VRLIASVYRADHPAHTDLSRTTQESREDPGRFNTSRLGAVYLSLEPETAIKELRRNGGVPSECALFVVRTRLAQVLDLTEHGAMAAWNLTTEDLQADDVARCQEAAEAAAAAGNEAIIWPSATGDGRSVAVFADRLGDGSGLEIVHQVELSSAALRSVEAGARVSALFPSLRA